MSTATHTSEESYGKLVAPRTIEIQRLLPGPIERIWDYLTKSDLREQWLAYGHMTPEKGSTLKLTWPLAKFSGERPEGIPTEHTLDSQIMEWNPPKKLAFTWNDGSIVTFELAPAGKRVLLKMIHKDITTRSKMVGVSTGWHAHLDKLVAVVSGEDGGVFWDQWKVHKADYEKRIPTEI
jgi:uncharacterized protein YndB with AHSA1/START domain